jgi:hypothetical protein
MNTRLLELALKGLEAERDSIDREIEELRSQLKVTPTPVQSRRQQPEKKHQRRRGITPAGRRKISEMMKARWAARRQAAAKK